LHVAATTVERLLDYVMNTAEDGLSSAASVNTLTKLIDNNKAFINKKESRKKNIVTAINK
jgi:4-O-beta-D-mannosyl-D-glucose phosphorylase